MPEVSPDSPPTTIEVWADIVCSWCYVGKRHLETALEAFPEGSVELRWRSFELDPTIPADAGSADEELARRRGLTLAEARAMHEETERMGADIGVHFDFARARRGNTFDAHRVLHMAHAEGRQVEVMDRLLAGYFGEGEPIGDRARWRGSRAARASTRPPWARCSPATSTPRTSAATSARRRRSASPPCRSSSSTGASAWPARTPRRPSAKRSSRLGSGSFVHVVWYTAMSIDGRIAGPGDDMSFLETVAGDGEERDFDDFIAGVDAIVIGSGTLRWLHEQGHDLPHRGLPIWLVSHDDELAARAAAADPDGTPVTRVEGDLAEILDAVAAAGHARAWIGGGGDIAGQALAADRVDEVILTVAPTVLGAGPAVFDHAGLPRRLFRLAECREYGSGSARLRWVRDRPPASSLTSD